MTPENKHETTHTATQTALPFPHSFAGVGDRTETVSLLFSIHTG